MPIFGANINIIGNKLQCHDDISLFGLSKKNDEHFHSTSEVYPEASDPILLEKASGAWAAFPTPTEIIPAGAINEQFDIHFASFSTISANGNYILKLYQGGVGSETVIATIEYDRNTNQIRQSATPEQTVVLPANTRISGAISSNNAAQDTSTVKLRFHRY